MKTEQTTRDYESKKEFISIPTFSKWLESFEKDEETGSYKVKNCGLYCIWAMKEFYLRSMETKILIQTEKDLINENNPTKRK